MTRGRLRVARAIGIAIVVVVFAAMLRTQYNFNESRGITDDICYLRQAHLFQRFGLDGINTDLARDDDGYFAEKLRQLGLPTDPNEPWCHHRMPGTGRVVTQYPPGPGFLLAAFPQGFQVAPLYMSVTAVLFLAAVATILAAPTLPVIAGSAAAGVLSIYLMNNPMKSSYSLPPTVIVCLLGGALTASLVAAAQWRPRLWLAAGLGLLFGLGVNARIGNVFLPAGVGLYLAVRFLRRPTLASFSEGVLLGAGFVVGVLPTLIANAINAGGPFVTTYGGQDVQPADFNPVAVAKQFLQYLRGTQGFLIALVIAACVAACVRGSGALRSAGAVATAGLAANLMYFTSHPVYTPYYAVPAALLASWTVFFAWFRAAGADLLVSSDLSR